MYELKIYRGVIMCHDNEEWCKIWRGIDLSFQNWHGEFDKFWLEHLEVSKMFTLMCSFLAEYNVVWARKVQRSYLSWHWRVIQNLEKNRHVVSKLTWGIWRILTEHLKISKTLTLMGSFWAEYILFELKKYRGVIFHDTEEWYKIGWRIGLLF